MEISPTGYVVLGFLNWRPRTGYEIKQVVDRSTRFFWAASYGQIYPELKRLEKQGLLEGAEEPHGKRRRTVWKLTGSGREALIEWLERPPETYELRDEALLKVFFSGFLPAEVTVDHLDAMKRRSEEKARALREIEPQVKASGGGTYLTLRFGIEKAEWIADWCEREKRALARSEKRRAA
jgi:PadR family transcriptional regulator AphA